MKYLLIAFLLISIYAAFKLGRFWYYVQYLKNPQIVHVDTTLGVGSELRYIAAGDSTAVGEGATSVEQTYSFKIAGELSKTNAVIYKNVAKRGARTEDVISSQLPQIIQFNPDIITISIGANDLTHRISSEQIINNFQTIVAELTVKTQAKVYLTNIPNFNGANLLPWVYIKYLEHSSTKINPELLKLESDRVRIINIHDFGWDKFPDKSVTYSRDHFHPSDIGYQNWTDAFLDKIGDKPAL